MNILSKIRSKIRSNFRSNHLSLKLKIVVSSLLVLFTTLLIFCIIMVSIVKNKIELQMKTDGNIIVEQIRQRLTSNVNITKELNEQLSEKIISSAYLIGSTPNITNEYLTKISKELSIDEINVSDASGVIIFSNMAGNLKYKYPEDHVVQKIIKDKDSQVIEGIRQSSNLKDNFYKYGAVATKSGGFVQIGILANRINTILNSVSTQALIDEIGKGENIAYALTIGKDLKIRTHTDKERIGVILDDDGSIAAAKDGKNYSSSFEWKGIDVYDVLIPIYEGINTQVL